MNKANVLRTDQWTYKSFMTRIAASKRNRKRQRKKQVECMRREKKGKNFWRKCTDIHTCKLFKGCPAASLLFLSALFSLLSSLASSAMTFSLNNWKSNPYQGRQEFISFVLILFYKIINSAILAIYFWTGILILIRLQITKMQNRLIMSQKWKYTLSKT